MSVDSYEPELRVLGEKLMHHQCWFFGRDIWHPDGNLLIRYGFERHGVPSGEKGGNAYRLKVSGECELVLWGFGVFFGREARGGVFIRRYGFDPRLTSRSSLKLPIANPDAMPPNRRPQSVADRRTANEFTAEIIVHFLTYEDWIERECGRRWRTKCLRDWSNAELNNAQIRRGWKKLQTKLGEL